MIPFKTLRSSVSGSVSIGTQNVYGTKLTVFGDSNFKGDSLIQGDLTVIGNLTALGDFIALDTIVSVTSALSVINAGSGTGLVVNQTGANSIVDFRDDGSSVFFIADGGNVGIKNNNPQATLDVYGNVKTKDHGTSLEWHSTYTTVSAFSGTWSDVVNVGNRVSNLEVISARLWDSVYTTVSAYSASWGAGSSIVAVISSVIDNVSGSQIKLGTPEDGSFTQCGAYQRWSASRTITDAIDDLNEVVENVRNNTFIKSVFFDGAPTTGGAGMIVTLNITVTGNANYYEVNWGDGTPTQGYAISSPQKQYNSNVGSPFTIALSAYNNNGCGAGSFSNTVRTGFIVVYTANPVSQYNLYRNEAGPGGTVLTGNNLYVRTSLDTLYLENTSLNTTPAAATYTISWGEGIPTAVANNAAAGGVGGPRASRSYSITSGAGTVPVNLAVNSYTTANPAIFPVNGAASNLKVYDSAIAIPQNLSFKTFTNSSTVAAGNLCTGYQTNSIASPPAAGTATNRVTTGTFITTDTGSLAHYANNGVVSILLNDAVSPTTRTMNGAGGNNGTYGTSPNPILTISNDSDFNLFDSTGAATTFANSIYYPGLYRGFRAALSVDVTGGLAVGTNSLQFRYQLSPDPAIVSSTRYILTRDDVTSSPTVDTSTTTITEQAAGTYRYVSGIPYYNTGGIVRVSGVKMYNWLGQVYSTATGAPVNIAAETALEGSGSVITSSNLSYVQVNNIASSYLGPGNVPNANTGKTIATPYTFGDLLISLPSSNVNAAGRIRYRGTNMNGIGAFSTINDKIIQVLNGTLGGFVEDNITSIPGGTFGAAKRIRITGASGGTPAYVSATDYYANTPFTGTAAVNIAGTDEAVVRYNTSATTQQLRHFAVNLATGYLPVGYDLATGRSGTQYFRAAFKRSTGQNFTFAIAGKISGFWIAAPGTAIDTTSTLNGWLDGNLNYQGSGTPGVNSGPGGTNGCATGTNGVIPLGSVLVANIPYTLTLGNINLSFSTTKQLLISIALAPTDYVNSLTITAIT